MILEDIDRKPTKSERVAEAAMENSLRRIRLYRYEIDMKTQTLFREYFPDDWHSLEDKYPDRPKRTRITARFDADVVNFLSAAARAIWLK
ncbi:MAG: hypothetical protein AAED33_14710 [Paracoccaceae bacterium]